jgi:hypothetical protein
VVQGLSGKASSGGRSRPECWGTPGISALFCYTLLKPSLFTKRWRRRFLRTSPLVNSPKFVCSIPHKPVQINEKRDFETP